MTPPSWIIFQFIFEELRNRNEQAVILTCGQIGLAVGLTDRTTRTHLAKLKKQGLIRYQASGKKHNSYNLNSFAIDWTAVQKEVPLRADFTAEPFSLPEKWYASAQFIKGPQNSVDVWLMTASGKSYCLPEDSKKAIWDLVEQDRGKELHKIQRYRIAEAITFRVSGRLLASLAMTFAVLSTEVLPTPRAIAWYVKVIAERCASYDPEATTTRRSGSKRDNIKLIHCVSLSVL